MYVMQERERGEERGGGRKRCVDESRRHPAPVLFLVRALSAVCRADRARPLGTLGNN